MWACYLVVLEGEKPMAEPLLTLLVCWVLALLWATMKTIIGVFQVCLSILLVAANDARYRMLF